MKNYLVFIAILLSNFSRSYSCGYSPFGEDIRFSLCSPEYFNYQDFKAFNYNSNRFGFDGQFPNQYESNVFDWYEFANKQVSLEAINECMNSLKFSDIQSTSPNQFVQYLFKNNLSNVLQYLKKAKKSEYFNTFEIDDTWERNEVANRQYPQFLNELQLLINAGKNAYLQRKYAFITIRTAYYCHDYSVIKTLFETHFAKGKKDYLYYWALYFNSFENKNISVDIANIMAYSAEKKYACYYYFHKQFNLENALRNATNATDIANLYAFASVQRLEPNLDYLKQIYTHCSSSRILDFLLLREINKIEDWVYTPYYTNNVPSIEFASDRWSARNDEIQSTETMRTRSEKDRLYAQQVLEFVQSVDRSTILDASLWNAAEIQLLFITRKYEECLRRIVSFKKHYANEKVVAQIEKIQALCLIANQEVGKAVITNEAKLIILKYLHDAHFIFSLGRELEFLKNLPDGLALITYGSQGRMNRYDDDFYSHSTVTWQGNRLRSSGNLKYFYNYFDYVDFVYSADELENVVNKLKIKNSDEFYKVVYEQLLRDENNLKDLLGTKYFRENNLAAAKRAFQSASQTYWDENYNAWERDKYYDYYMFDKNPFYDINYTPVFIPHLEKYVVTKLSITSHLIKYLEIANNPITENKDYYYFIIANCYLNMTQYGHSWMMRRFASTTNYTGGNNETYIDEMEYRNGTLAQKYYQLAYENAKTDKFKALCLRMEEYAKDNIGSTYKSLNSVYPQYVQDLSSCVNLEGYFKSRR